MQGVGAYQTFEIASPIATHTRPASCREVDCEQYTKGWTTKVFPDSDEEGWLRQSGRKWSTVTKAEDGFNIYLFPPGQPCFRASTHRVSLERPEIYRVWPGDWRARIGEAYVHTRAANWVDQFAEHQNKLADIFGRG